MFGRIPANLTEFCLEAGKEHHETRKLTAAKLREKQHSPEEYCRNKIHPDRPLEIDERLRRDGSRQ